MSEDLQDGLWPHFVPLWADLRAITPKLLLAGGYALFLKQRWLIAQARTITASSGATLVDDKGTAFTAVTVPTLIDMTRWSEVNPRVTKDFDFIVSLELIASEGDQKMFDAVLAKHGFEVVTRNARWQFEKKVTADQSVLLDFHAPSPTEPRADLRVEKRRVKPGRSLGSTGIHGRENPEANATELHPFTFTYQSLELLVPHPLAFAIMKLMAMNDRWRAASAATSPEERHAEGSLARKHAEDLMRIVAMTTRSEMDLTETMLAALGRTPSYAAAAQVFAESFRRDDGWATTAVARNWRDDDFALMRDILNQWFSPLRAASS